MKLEKNDGINLVFDPFAMEKIRCRRGHIFLGYFVLVDNSSYDEMSGRTCTGISSLALILKAIRPCAERVWLYDRLNATDDSYGYYFLAIANLSDLLDFLK